MAAKSYESDSLSNQNHKGKDAKVDKSSQDDEAVVEKHRVCVESTDCSLLVCESSTAQFIRSPCFSISWPGLFQSVSFGAGPA
jgi:hypothetical protein